MATRENSTQQVIDVTIKIGTIAILLYWCFSILQPFILLVIWGAIIAIALYPIAMLISRKTRLSAGKSSGLLSFLGVLILLIPLIALSSGIVTSTTEVVGGLQDGTLVLPKPKASIQELPLVGEKLYAGLTYASSNLEGAMVKYSAEIKQFTSQAAAVVGSIAGGLIQFIISTIIAGAFMANASACQSGVVKFANRLTDNNGSELVNLSKSTVRGVVQGVIGVATIQSIMSALGLVIAGVPAAGLWALAVLLVAIIQLPPILALIPAIIYMFSVESTMAASIFLVWCLIVSGSDAFLKPMLLSRGSSVPTLVILLGALGGMAMSGIVGLFVGAVVLSLTYQLLVSWLEGENSEEIE